MDNVMELKTLPNPFANITDENRLEWAGKVVAVNLATHEVIAVAESAEELRVACQNIPVYVKWARFAVPSL